MENEPQISTLPSPSIIEAFSSGFNRLAENPALLIFPVLLDLVIWLGPRLRVKELFTPVVNQLGAYITLEGLDPTQAAATMQSLRELLTAFLQQFNLAVYLRVYPVGIPSLMAGVFATEAPIPTATIEINSMLAMLGLWALFSLVGLAVGSVYFSWVAHATLNTPIPPRRLGWNFLQSFFLTALLVIAGMILSVPAILLLSLVSLLDAALAQVTLLVMILMLSWVALPLIYSPFGVYAYQQNILRSILTGIAFTRIMLPGSSLFVLAGFTLVMGLDVVWKMATPDSWVMLIGIGGHAVICTAVLAAGFNYFNNGVLWMQEKAKQALLAQARQIIK